MNNDKDPGVAASSCFRHAKLSLSPHMYEKRNICIGNAQKRPKKSLATTAHDLTLHLNEREERRKQAYDGEERTVNKETNYQRQSKERTERNVRDKG